jgi:hypothetical protein
MATPLLQKARQRKMIYFGAIIVLFTLSLIHREFVVKQQAIKLQLLESTRGEIKLTSSAVRLLLTGSRGLAVTILWYNAMDKQKRSEWNELELLVESITQLQPYFVTPWLYQSWNISFNVAVECDRPRDKYYYISRGLELLAEGERRNSGKGDESLIDDPNKIVFPGNPEMRHYMGFTYQLKMGTSDERLTMRCLLEMSCIDPIERNPDRFWTTDEKTGEQKVDLKKFAPFCQKYPQLVRRLSEQLSYSKPEQVVKFLQDNQNIPSRFKPIEKGNIAQARESELKAPRDQFPLLPPYESGWPDPTKMEMTSEAMGVYLVSRTWFQFAQKPLPPPEKTPGPQSQTYDKMRYRVPKQMVTQIFRQYPARAQVYIAETLEAEGFFDGDGWDVPRWFDELVNNPNSEFRNDEGKFIVGTEPKYHSRRAWEKGHEMYKDFGEKNGVYFSPTYTEELNKQAEVWRKKFNMGAEQMPAPLRAELKTPEMVAAVDAQTKLYWAKYYRGLVNFDTFFYQSEAEADPVTVAARKQLFYAERKLKREVPSEVMLSLYDQAWPMYVHACLKFPRFAKVTSMQEDFYEGYQKYLRECQKVRSELFKQKLVLAAKLPFCPYPTEIDNPTKEDTEKLAAQLAFWPYPDWRAAVVRWGVVTKTEKEEQQMQRVPYIKKRTGPIDRVQYYDGPNANKLREVLFGLTQGFQLAQNMSFAATVTFPGHEYHMLTRTGNADEPLPDNWKVLITPETRRIARNRLGLDR